MGADCEYPQCINGICADPSCSDGVTNGDETDRDCGGSCPFLCKVGQDCIVNADCLSDICSNGICQGPGCTDGAKDNNETDVDCGGPDCAPCGLQKACKIGSDCLSVSCQNLVCVAPTCMDSAQNGSETDLNCGGGTCPACGVGKFCVVNSDCTSGVCVGLVCQQSTCTDGVKNGNETDVDCGGACPKCALSQTCTSASDCASNACAANKCTCPTKMVIVPIMGGGIACIDAYETTYSDYLAFFNANPSTANQPAACSWNTSYTPSGAWPPAPANLNEPVRYVDWCDASAYCAYFGKHLCGALTGGPNAPADFADPTKSTWFDACSAQGNNDYPYGDAFLPAACNGAPALNVVVESALATCLGGSPGLYHMSGNVAEWEDSCTGAALPTDDCRVRGGSFQSSMGDLRCDANVLQQRAYAGPDVGFRCCL